MIGCAGFDDPNNLPEEQGWDIPEEELDELALYKEQRDLEAVNEAKDN